MTGTEDQVGHLRNVLIGMGVLLKDSDSGPEAIDAASTGTGNVPEAEDFKEKLRKILEETFDTASSISYGVVSQSAALSRYLSSVSVKVGDTEQSFFGEMRADKELSEHSAALKAWSQIVDGSADFSGSGSVVGSGASVANGFSNGRSPLLPTASLVASYDPSDPTIPNKADGTSLSETPAGTFSCIPY